VPAAAALPAARPRYELCDPAKELRQGEIVSKIKHYAIEIDDGNPAKAHAKAIEIEYAITGSQDCDLLHSFRALNDGQVERINGILFFEAEEAVAFKERHKLSAKEIKFIREHRDPGRHFLTLAEVDHLDQGLPELIVDFKRYFMVPTLEVYRQIKMREAFRRCFLSDTYRFQLQDRAMHFMGRVALPEE
jgi:hypothetical protein